MSEIKVNKISPKQTCTTVTLGDSGDDFVVATGANLKTAAVKDTAGNVIVSRCGSNITIGSSGAAIALACGATQTGFGRTGTVDWDTTPKTATFSAVSGNGYFCNTSGGAFTVNLPAGSAGAIVSLADYAATWQTNNLTVSPNGSEKIGSVNADAVLSTEGQSVTFVYVDSTQGWINTMDSTSNVRGNPFLVATGGTETTCGNCKIHTFTAPGTFTVSSASTTAPENIVSYLVVGGGAGGGTCHGAGGGGGGFREIKSPLTPYAASPLDGYSTPGNRVTVTAQAYPITVGGGGTGAPCATVNTIPATNGSNSVFSTITSTGGGKGANGNNASLRDGGPGGSGGGSSSGPGSTRGTVGAGNTPPTSPSQGTNGGQGGGDCATWRSGAGGGGATVAGGSTSPSTPGPTAFSPGGTGATTNISGSPVGYAGGGGGGGTFVAGTASPCGSGTAGLQSVAQGAPTGNGPNATSNRGGGAGGIHGNPPGSQAAGNGGSGIVIIRYKYQ